MLPLYAASLSAVLFFGRFLSLWVRRQDKISQDPHGVERPDAQLAPERLTSRLKQLVTRRGGHTIFLFKVVRLLACIALALLSVISVTRVKQYGDSNHFQTFKIYHQVLVVSYVGTIEHEFKPVT